MQLQQTGIASETSAILSQKAVGSSIIFMEDITKKLPCMQKNTVKFFQRTEILLDMLQETESQANNNKKPRTVLEFSNTSQLGVNNPK